MFFFIITNNSGAEIELTNTLPLFKALYDNKTTVITNLQTIKNGRPSITANYARILPTIDGVLNAGEWNNALQILEIFILIQSFESE